MNSYINRLIFGFLILGIFNACMTTKSVESHKPKNLPAGYLYGNDSSNLSDLNWKEYFKDPHLISLIDTALKNNFDVMIAMSRIESSRSNVLFSKGALLPTFSGHVSAAQRRYGLYTMDGAGNISTQITPGQIVPIHLQDYYIGLQTSWEVDVWGKLRNRKKSAVARYLGSIEGKNLVITSLVSEVALNYYELLALDYELEIIQETITLQQEALELVRVQKEAGVVNELAVQQFEAQWLNSKVMEKEVLQRILETESRINLLLGRYPQAVERNKSAFIQSMPFDIQVGLPSDLLENRPDIRQAEYELIATKADVKAAKAAFYPSLNITGAMGFQAFKTGYLFISPQSIAYSIFGGLTAPLINRKAIKAGFRNAKANQQTALYHYQKTIINGYVEVYNEVARIRNLEGIRNLKKRQVDVLTQSIETSSDLFKTGRASYIEVLLTQRTALDSRLELIKVRKRQYFSVINIYKALGGGW